MGRQIIIKGADFSANAYTNTEGYIPYTKIAEKATAYTYINENSGEAFGRTKVLSSTYTTTVYGIDVSEYVGKTLHFTDARFVRTSSSLEHGGITATALVSVLIVATELSSVTVNTTEHFYTPIMTTWPLSEAGELSEFSLTVPSGAKSLLFYAQSSSTPTVKVINE